MRVTLKLLFFVLIFWMQAPASAKDWVNINAEKPISEKTALVIFNGFGGSKSGCKAQMAFWEDRGMDVLIPDVLLRKSLDDSSAALREFAQEYHLEDYAEVKAICYIAGAYLMHTYVAEWGLPNLSQVIYDRSPTQERAPRAVMDRFPMVGVLALGPVLRDLSNVDWPEPPAAHVLRGLMVENRATSIMRILESEARAMGPLEYNWQKIDPLAADAFHLPLDHDMMYIRWDILGEPCLHFFEHGAFPADLPRERLNDNPFDKSLPIPEVVR